MAEMTDEEGERPSKRRVHCPLMASRPDLERRSNSALHQTIDQPGGTLFLKRDKTVWLPRKAHAHLGVICQFWGKVVSRYFTPLASGETELK